MFSHSTVWFKGNITGNPDEFHGEKTMVSGSITFMFDFCSHSCSQFSHGFSHSFSIIHFHVFLMFAFLLFLTFYMGMDQYLLIPFLVGWPSINPSYFDVNKKGVPGFWHTATCFHHFSKLKPGLPPPSRSKQRPSGSRASAAAASEVVAPRGALPQGLPTPRGYRGYGGYPLVYYGLLWFTMV